MPASARPRICAACCLLQRSEHEPTQVAYRGAGPAMNDMMSGQVDVMCDQIVNVVCECRRRQRSRATPSPARSARPRCRTCRPPREAGLPDFHLHRLVRPVRAEGYAQAGHRQARRRAERSAEGRDREDPRLAALGVQPVSPERAHARCACGSISSPRSTSGRRSSRPPASSALSDRSSSQMSVTHAAERDAFGDDRRARRPLLGRADATRARRVRGQRRALSRLPVPRLRLAEDRRRACQSRGSACLMPRSQQPVERCSDRTSRRPLRRSLSADDLADRVWHPDQHERQRGDREPRQ